jgi:intracellular sulfur oxidation DsrE/DsrF family protein
MSKLTPSPSERRSFFSSLHGGLLGFAALAVGGKALAQERPSIVPRFEPLRHDKDDWLDIPARHRMVFDTTNLTGAAEAVFFANNFVRTNKSDYNLDSKDLAVVIIVRHNSTAFGYNDAMWAKYGAPMAARAGVEDPKSKQAPKLNLLASGDYTDILPNRGVTWDAVFKLGVQLAVCQSSTRANAQVIAKATGGDTEAIFKELSANLVSSNARLVPAGIVTVNRAQERGYSLVRT